MDLAIASDFIKRCATAVLLSTLWVCASSANDGEVAAIRSGTLVFTSAESEPVAIPRLRTDVSVAIEGTLARVELRQRFRNPSDQWAEAVYAFPLPSNARLERISTVQDGKLVSSLSESQPSALHPAGRLLRMPLPDIAPHASVDIVLGYIQTLPRAANGQHLRVPLADNRGPIPDLSIADEVLESVPAATWVQIANQGGKSLSTAHTHAVSVRVRFSAEVTLANIASRHHAIQVSRSDHTTIEVELRNAPDADFELDWAAAELQLHRM
jgi:Ca-activated chloride channel family protein